MRYVTWTAAALGLGLSAAGAQEARLPVWELGVGAVARVQTDYPGADDYAARIAPVPYLKYRGKVLEIGGEEALRVVPIRTDRFELGLSFDSSARVENRVTTVGSALPELDRAVEAGPELIFRLVDQPALFGLQLSGHIEALLQTRGVFSIGKDIDWQGTLYRPAIRYREYGTLGPGSRIQVSLGPIWTTGGLQAFYYETPDYEARSGYLGTEARGAVRFPITERLQAFGGISVTYLGGAANADSPLMKTDWDGALFVGLRYSFWQSAQRTTRDR